ncbi:MXAN_6230/SCO0854 family RING domain-containing protein [Streptomyces sp. NPDC101227]|uniref:MXAN_6230/SCO0854 family RING domain-containing protein n=1 Tax=Streptomyces sp. NPDC101227 TaxID=3366136 RepID=UPI0038146F13
MSTLQSVLIRRAGIVHLRRAPTPRADPRAEDGLRLLESDLLDRGHALTGPLRAALAALGREGLTAAGTALLAAVDAGLGADRTHRPLFRGFPHQVPTNTHTLYVDRVFAVLLQEPAQPCVLCGTVGSVHPVAPCAHLVCRACWDGANYDGCPICHRRINAADPFLKPHTPGTTRQGRSVAGPLRLLTLGTDPKTDATAELAVLLARRTPLSPQDRTDVRVLLEHAPAHLEWLPDDIPLRETKALVLATLLRAERTAERIRPRLPGMLTTATDVLRLLVVWSGGEADLTEPPRLRTLPRPLRRRLLAVLDALAPHAVAEDLLRHPRLWRRAAEILHPYERHTHHPRAAVAFAVLRGTPLSGPLGEALRRSAEELPHFTVAGDRIRLSTWGERVERALSEGDLPRAVAALAARPGELVRRLDHVLRLHKEPEPLPELVAALRRGLPTVGPGPLLSALGRLRGRHLPDARRRLFFPRGRVTHAVPEAHPLPPLAAALTRPVAALLEEEALRRLAAGPRYDLAVLDPALADLALPANERGSSATLVDVPRGTTLRVPGALVLRLFLHWMQPPGTRVDLDLSVAFFDADWQLTDLCDYTALRAESAGAVHSGDLTSAPGPHGATEYVDLDLTAPSAGRARYAVVIVFSYNDIPFDDLPDAFAGFMELPADARPGAAYDPRSVRQRFDLTGDSRVCVPMLVDLQNGSALWTDVHLPPSGGYHNVDMHAGPLGVLGRHLIERYTAPGRVTLWDLSVWHAAARTDEVAVLHRAAHAAPDTDRKEPDNVREPDGTDEVWTYRRSVHESDASFAARIRTGAAPDARTPTQDADALAAETASGRRVLLALVDGTVAPDEATGTLYRLYPGPADGVSGLRRTAAGDLVAALETGVGTGGGKAPDAPVPDDGGAVAVSGGPYPQ